MARSTMEVAFRQPMVPTSVPALIECAEHGRPGQKRRWFLHQSRHIDKFDAPFTLRDLCQTCKTLMGKVALDKQLRDRIQGHAFNDVCKAL
ncbi:hypothetical protein NA644_20300 [Pseudomonas stutzeri]|uniref:hypothetical protein n=1 Tax=Stutzerimonas stutzeri TaxID=316 RepID=UPI0021088A8D|nr:hypothetical protein [Stutzerimonas stutzeri]MCQ4251652.1 hypothetical protein [Stutzerimonas stutzeri]